jgi:hypothetical protein
LATNLFTIIEISHQKKRVIIKFPVGLGKEKIVAQKWLWKVSIDY